MNLISNALKYTPSGGKVKIYNQQVNDCVTFVVEDSGKGFTSEEIKRCFSRFGKFEREGDVIAEGSGVGLYMVHELANHHNGKVWVESEGRDKGSKFFVEFPKGD